MSSFSSQVLTETDQPEPIAFPVDGAEIWLHTRKSPERTTPNEDAVGTWALPHGGFVLAVADGLGGMPQGRVAAARAMAVLDGRFRELQPEGDSIRAAILDAFEAANAAVIELGGAGTTLVVAEVHDETLRTYHVGDSAAMLVGQRGKRKWETISHSPVGYGVAAGLIDEAKALQHEDRHYLSNHLGVAEMHIELGSLVAIAPRDTLLLASDGLLDNLAPEEIVDIVRAGPLGKAARRLADGAWSRMNAASERGKPDDTTFVLFRRQPAS